MGGHGAVNGNLLNFISEPRFNVLHPCKLIIYPPQSIARLPAGIRLKRDENIPYLNMFVTKRDDRDSSNPDSLLFCVSVRTRIL